MSAKLFNILSEISIAHEIRKPFLYSSLITILVGTSHQIWAWFTFFIVRLNYLFDEYFISFLVILLLLELFSVGRKQ